MAARNHPGIRRLTFRIDEAEVEIIDLDYEDYHQEADMAAVQGIRMKNPAHPGGFVKSEVIEPLGLTVTDAAQVLGVTRAALSAVLNERAHLSPEMALRIEKAFGVSMDTLMRMQNSFDIARPASARAKSTWPHSRASPPTYSHRCCDRPSCQLS